LCVPEVLKRAAAMYDEKRELAKVGERKKKYTELVATQNRITEQLKKHIKEEKLRLTAFF
jgi:uncharacterized membrane protein YgaE (UPF0421/DUF939 family)